MNRFKFIHNILLTIVMLLLMDPRSFYGLTFHEWAGLVIGILFILHTALNWTWIKKVTLGFFRRSPGKARLNYVLDIILLAGMVLMILSGIAIAKTIDFSWLNLGGSRMFWRVMHTSSSLITLVLFGIHLGLHWKWVLQRFKIKRINKWSRKISITLLSLAIVIVGVFAFNELHYWERSARIFKLNIEQSFGRDFGRNRGGHERRNRSNRSDDIQEGRAKQGRNGSVSKESGEFQNRGTKKSRQGRGKYRRGKKIQLYTVLLFLAVFAGFTVLTYYLEVGVKKIRRKGKNNLK